MTKEEKCEAIKFFIERKSAIGILGVFAIDDAYKDVEFAKFIIKTEPEMIKSVSSILEDEMNKKHDGINSAMQLLKTKKLSKSLSVKVASYLDREVDFCRAICEASKDLIQTFKQAI